MRTSWQDHIRKTHAKLSKKNKQQAYHDSMREASKTWEKEKVKIIKRNKKQVRLQKQSAASKAYTKADTSGLSTSLGSKSSEVM